MVAPKGMKTRPITDKIKEALFSIWQMEIVDANFLDLFAGSGSMGIEALSRGARNVVFVERDYHAVQAIKNNLASCNFSDCFTIFKDDVFQRIHWLYEAGRLFDIIYLDPPFTIDEIFLPVMEALSNQNILAKNGVIAIRTRKEKDMPTVIGTLEKFKFKTYGISGVHFYRRML